MAASFSILFYSFDHTLQVTFSVFIIMHNLVPDSIFSVDC